MQKYISNAKNNNLRLANLYISSVISTLEKAFEKEKNYEIKKLIYEKIIKSYIKLERFL